MYSWTNRCCLAVRVLEVVPVVVMGGLPCSLDRVGGFGLAARGFGLAPLLRGLQIEMGQREPRGASEGAHPLQHPHTLLSVEPI